MASVSRREVLLHANVRTLQSHRGRLARGLHERSDPASARWEVCASHGHRHAPITVASAEVVLAVPIVGLSTPATKPDFLSP